MLLSFRVPSLAGLLRSLALSLMALSASGVSAHLMPSQKGTLNIQGNGAYLVVSLPVTAFARVDEDQDGAWSESEFVRHTERIHQQLAAGITLSDASGAPRPMHSVSLSPTAYDDAEDSPLVQVVVLARFELAHAVDPQNDRPLAGHRLRIALFGTTAAERRLDLTVTQGTHTQWLHLEPEHDTQALFPSDLAVFTQALQWGWQHIVEGWDHLLFLLVVLLAGGTAAQLLLALSAFTVGHALTLAWGVWGQLPVSTQWVEVAIAATIVLMAVWEGRLFWRGQTLPLTWRTVLVFACALVHGMGLVGGLQAMGLVGEQKVWAVLGFNLGIELAQCVVALGVWAIWHLGLGRRSRRWHRMGHATLSAVAALIGLFWMIQRAAY